MTAPRSAVPYLQDIIAAGELVLTEVEGAEPEVLLADRRRRWIVERGIEIISEASRRLPDDLKARHPQRPWIKIAGIGNVLRHNYDRVAPDVLWRVAQDDLPSLPGVCGLELTASLQSENLD